MVHRTVQHVINTPFERATYTYAVRVLEKSNKKFEFPVSGGGSAVRA